MDPNPSEILLETLMVCFPRDLLLCKHDASCTDRDQHMSFSSARWKGLSYGIWQLNERENVFLMLHLAETHPIRQEI
jgi:hypothetical protein